MRLKWIKNCDLRQFLPKRRYERYVVAETAIERDSVMPYNFTKPIKPMFQEQENARLKWRIRYASIIQI